MSPEIHKNKIVSVGNYVFTGNTLGKGNFAKVEEAVHNILNVKVAVKIIDINHIKEDYVIKNLYREAKIMSKLNHPCIVSLFQTMQRSDNVYYFVAEIANGGDLCAFVKKQANGKLSEKQTKIYAKQFSSALCHMHNLRVVHRDLKMENVMLNSIQTQIKIVDFGLSNFWSADSPLRTHCGSPEYAAPELFITGKKYGAEVDLWSFGIILYGMVLGQLPFVTSRSQEMPSQERRKQLVAQINKGLSTFHRRALSPFSPEFRSLMNRLLVSDSSRRITTKELIIHPWITDKGKKMICTNPLKNLDSYEKSKIIGQISTILQVEPKVISSTVVQDAYGKVGGMFNILKRRYQLSQIQGDGAAKTMPSMNIYELANLKNSLQKETNLNNIRDPKLKLLQAALQKPQTAQTQTKKVNYSPKISLSDGRRPNISIIPEDTKSNIKAKKKSSQMAKVRPSTVKELYDQEKLFRITEDAVRPITVPPIIEQKSAPVDYRSIQSPSLRRKVYSATVTNKVMSSPIPKSPDKKIRYTDQSEKQQKEVATAEKSYKKKNIIFREKTREIKPKDSTHAVKSKEGTTKTFVEHKRSNEIKNARKQLLEISNAIVRPTSQARNKLASVTPGKETLLRSPELISDHARAKSEQTPRRRSITTPLHHVLETSIKGAGISSPKTKKKYIGTSGTAPVQRSKRSSGNKDEGWERSHLAYGDYATRASTSPATHNRKFAIYDPIARSIADYVSNNVSNKIYHYPWVKK